MWTYVPVFISHTHRQAVRHLSDRIEMLARASDHVSVLQREEKVPGVRGDAFAARL